MKLATYDNRPTVTDEMLVGPKLTVREAAATAGVSRDKVERAIRDGELLAINNGTPRRAMYRIPRQSFLDWQRRMQSAAIHHVIRSMRRLAYIPKGTHTQWRRSREGSGRRDR